MAPTRVLVVDDNILFRWNLMEALSKQDLEIVEEASNGYEGAEKALALRPDVVLSDLHMPGSDGIAATQLLQQKAPEIKVLILTVSDKDESLLAALNSGARGYLLKNESIDMIAKAINYVALGGIVISPSMANKLHVDFGSPTPAIGDSTTTDAPEAAVEESKSTPPLWKPLRLLMKTPRRRRRQRS
ncbi:MAG: response regulator transcription factor [Chloroflexi bacterium]|nr:response regulator transcription factor [Chloroflexota bacterium]